MRFGFGMPFVLVLVGILHFYVGYVFPPVGAKFLVWVFVGSLSQIGATFVLIHLFSLRNFAVGTAYSRTEPVQAAIFSLLFLGEGIGSPAIVAIAVSMFGVMLISVARDKFSIAALITSLGQRIAVLGLVCGTGFGFSAVSYRAASLALAGPNFIMQGAVTLAFAITIQTTAMLIWMCLREPGQFVLIRKAWRPSLIVGIAGACASFGWFMAMTLQNAAIVKALAQVEMIFTFATSLFFFREKINRLEILGCLFVVAGILVLVLLR